jgi:hypothetical protein
VKTSVFPRDQLPGRRRLNFGALMFSDRTIAQSMAASIAAWQGAFRASSMRWRIASVRSGIPSCSL